METAFNEKLHKPYKTFNFLTVRFISFISCMFLLIARKECSCRFIINHYSVFVTLSTGFKIKEPEIFYEIASNRVLRPKLAQLRKVLR